MTTEILHECSNCGHDMSEHLGTCHTDLFAGGSWRKCSCETYALGTMNTDQREVA